MGAFKTSKTKSNNKLLAEAFYQLLKFKTSKTKSPEIREEYRNFRSKQAKLRDVGDVLEAGELPSSKQAKLRVNCRPGLLHCRNTCVQNKQN